MILLLMLLSIVFAGQDNVVSSFGFWKDKPNIVVCANYPGDISFIKKSVNNIHNKSGGKFGQIKKDSCRVMRPGFIYIMGPGNNLKNNPKALGITMTNLKGNLITYAIIEIKPGYDASAVLTHELLHALGLEHALVDDHILTRYLNSAGWSWEGISKALERRSDDYIWGPVRDYTDNENFINKKFFYCYSHDQS